MAEFPALSLWTDAFIADTVHLTNEQIGVYIKLLVAAWRGRDCNLPDIDSRLATIVGMTRKKWTSTRPAMAELFTVRNGLWTQKRLTFEREKVRGLSKRGHAGAAARWTGKSLNDIDSDDAQALREHMPNGCLTDAPISIPILEDDEMTRGRKLLRERILSSIGADPVSGLHGPNGRQFGTLADMQRVKGWQSLGLTDDEIVGVAAEVVSRMKEPVISLRLFDRDMAKLAVAKSAPPPSIQEENHGKPAEGRRDHRASQLSRIVAAAAKGTT